MACWVQILTCPRSGIRSGLRKRATWKRAIWRWSGPAGVRESCSRVAMPECNRIPQYSQPTLGTRARSERATHFWMCWMWRPDRADRSSLPVRLQACRNRSKVQVKPRLVRVFRSASERPGKFSIGQSADLRLGMGRRKKCGISLSQFGSEVLDQFQGTERFASKVCYYNKV